MAILQSIDYSKFKKFSNIADEISAKLLSNFLESEVMVAGPDQCDFEFSIKTAERKRWTEDSNHYRKLKLLITKKFQKSFQSYLGNSNNKTSLVK